jgi:hypothetical protein
MLESAVEKYLKERVEAIPNCYCEKHVAPGRRGVPDRLVTWHFGQMDLVETKKPDAKAREEQIRDHRRRAKAGVPVYLLDTKLKVGEYVAWRRCGLSPAHLRSVPLLGDAT